MYIFATKMLHKNVVVNLPQIPRMGVYGGLPGGFKNGLTIGIAEEKPPNTHKIIIDIYII